MNAKRWVTELRKALRASADVERAAQMQAYMKSALPYFGVPLPEVRKLAKTMGKLLTFGSFTEYDAFVRTVYGEATHREERYAALTLMDLKQTRVFHTLEARGLYEWLITEGAWWDLVDEVANHRVSEWFDVDAKGAAKILRTWSRSDNLWLRRSAIIGQVPRKAVDLVLLFEVIEPAIREKEFFLRKAIGWALRAAAKHHPKDVRAYVEQNRTRLSGLSVREAEKGLAKAPQ